MNFDNNISNYNEKEEGDFKHRDSSTNAYIQRAK